MRKHVMFILLMVFITLGGIHHTFGQNILAPVKSGELWGFIDKSGNWAIKPAFAEARPFAEGQAAVKNNKR